jgi:arginyl-tRNA synthetase
MDEMVAESEKQTRELGKIDELGEGEAKELFEMIGLGALKYFLLKVDPKKRMMFDPSDSIQLQGHTGPFIQYTHARIKAILRKGNELGTTVQVEDFKNVTAIEPIEQELLYMLSNYEQKLEEAAREYSPSIIANFAYELAKSYNQFYQTIPIFNGADQSRLKFRIGFSSVIASTLESAMRLLGIRVPERM